MYPSQAQSPSENGRLAHQQSYDLPANVFAQPCPTQGNFPIGFDNISEEDLSWSAVQPLGSIECPDTAEQRERSGDISLEDVQTMPRQAYSTQSKYTILLENAIAASNKYWKFYMSNKGVHHPIVRDNPRNLKLLALDGLTDILQRRPILNCARAYALALLADSCDWGLHLQRKSAPAPSLEMAIVALGKAILDPLGRKHFIQVFEAIFPRAIEQQREQDGQTIVDSHGQPAQYARPYVWEDIRNGAVVSTCLEIVDGDTPVSLSHCLP